MTATVNPVPEPSATNQPNHVTPERVTWRGMRVCLIASLFFFYEFFQMNMVGAIAEPMRETFALTATGLGALSSYYFWANAMLIPFAGILLDRFSARATILCALGICVLGVVMLSQAPTVWVAQWSRFLTGIGGGFCFLSCMRLATLWFPPRHLALVTGVLVAVAMLGGMVAQAPLTWLTMKLGWRQATLFDAVAGVVVWFAVLLWVRDPRAQKPCEPSASSALPFWSGLRMAFFAWRNWCPALVAGLLNLPVIVLGGLVGINYISQYAQLAPDVASQVTAMLFLGMLVGSPVLGALSDRLGQRRVIMRWGGLCLLACMAYWLLGPLLPLSALCVLWFGVGFASSAQVLAYPMVAERNPPALTATAVSVVSMSCIGLGAVFEPWFGRLLDWHWQHHVVTMQAAGRSRLYLTTDYHFAAWSLVAVVAVALLLTLQLRESA